MLKENPFKKVVVKIDGMMCDNCIRHVDEALSEIDGVGVKSVKKGKAVISVHEDVENVNIRKAIEDVGYKTTKIKR